MSDEAKDRNPQAMDISEIRSTMIQIQLASIRIIRAIDIALSADECAEEMNDPPEDLDGNELEVGDKVSFITVHPNPHRYYVGMVCQVEGTYCVDCGREFGLFRIKNDLFNLRKMNDIPDNEPRLRGRR